MLVFWRNIEAVLQPILIAHSRKALILLLSFLSALLLFSSHSNAQTSIKKTVVEQKSFINQHYLLNKNLVPFSSLANDLAFLNENTTQLSNETLAKGYWLLAEAAHFYGDDTRELAYTLKGSQLPVSDNELKLQLLLKEITIYYELGKVDKISPVAEKISVLLDASNHYNNEFYITYQLSLLAYQAIAYASMGQLEQAFQYVNSAEQLLLGNQHLANNAELIELMATSYQYLNKSDIAAQLYTKSIKRRFDTNNTLHIERSYLHLASTYLKLNKLDDALNLFEEVQKYADEKGSNILKARADHGLATILFYKEKTNPQIIPLLTSATETFKGNNLEHLQFCTSLFMAEIYLDQGDVLTAEKWLSQATELSSHTSISQKHIKLFHLLATTEKANGNNRQALHYLERYIETSKQFHFPSAIAQNSSLLSTAGKSKLVVEMSKVNELEANYKVKFHQQTQTISWLLLTTFILAVTTIALLLKKRLLTIKYKSHEKSVHRLLSPAETKQTYQAHYKMARKFNYPLSVGYITIENWQELSFHFSEKILKDINKNIAILLNKSIEEFEHVGTVNQSEYIVLCPHQSVSYIEKKLKKIAAAIEGNLFASLGEFSLKVSIEYGEPAVQDIDPYIFLSLLSDKANKENL